MQRTALAAAALLCSCGGSGDGSDGSTPPPAPSGLPGGIYSGMPSPAVANPPSLTGIIDENGVARFVETTVPSGPNLYFLLAPGAVSLQGDDFSASDAQYFDVSRQSKDGTLSGSFTPKSNMTVTVNDGNGSSTRFALSYDAADYARPATLSAIAGSFSFSYGNPDITTGAFTIGSSGAITGTDSAGCRYNGSAAIPAAAFDAYDITLNTGCFGGAPLKGVAAVLYSTAGTPAEILMLVDNGSAGFAFQLQYH